MEIQVLRADLCDSAPVKKTQLDSMFGRHSSQGIKLALKSASLVPGLGDKKWPY